jgi:hypothetical protein
MATLEDRSTLRPRSVDDVEPSDCIIAENTYLFTLQALGGLGLLGTLGLAAVTARNVIDGANWRQSATGFDARRL